MAINKVIHYCWFGGNEKPDIINECIESWKKFCPEYKIIEWNELNMDKDFFEIDYVKEAFSAKKWAFVSDVARLWVIYKHGGIYMDTDVEIFQSLKNLLNFKSFFAFQCELTIATGLGFGAEKEDPLIKEMLNEYNNIHFIYDDGTQNKKACPEFNTKAVIRYVPEFKRTGQSQIYDNRLFMSCGDYEKIMTHYGTRNWSDTPNYNFVKSNRIYKDTALKRFLRKPSRVEFIEKHFNAKFYNLYIFFSYDVMEMGFKGVFRKFKSKVKSSRRNN